MMLFYLRQLKTAILLFSLLRVEVFLFLIRTLPYLPFSLLSTLVKFPLCDLQPTDAAPSLFFCGAYLVLGSPLLSGFFTTSGT